LLHHVLTIFLGSAVNGASELDSVKYNASAAAVCHATGKIVNTVQERMINGKGEEVEQNA